MCTSVYLLHWALSVHDVSLLSDGRTAERHRRGTVYGFVKMSPTAVGRPDAAAAAAGPWSSVRPSVRRVFIIQLIELCRRQHGDPARKCCANVTTTHLPTDRTAASQTDRERERDFLRLSTKPTVRHAFACNWVNVNNWSLKETTVVSSVLETIIVERLCIRYKHAVVIVTRKS